MPHAIRFTLVLTLICAAAAAQAVNDHCATAIDAGPGHTLGSTVGATTGPDPLGSCGLPGADVWYRFVAPCNGAWAASTCAGGTAFDTVLTIWDGTGGCGALVPIICNDDFCGQPFAATNSYATFQSVAGTTYYVSIAGHLAAQGSFELVLESILTELSFFSAGPGTIGYHVDGGPAGGIVYTAITLNPAFFPAGWFHGISIEFADIMAQVTAGFPFVMPVGPVCGEVTVGPFGGLPPGLTVYGVSLGIPPGATFPHPAFISQAESGAVP
jgi:hypothetical protein